MELNTENNLPGFWDPLTSTIDWCEPNYQHSHYIAETWNTLSNLIYIIGAFIFLLRVEKFYRTNNFTRSLRLPRLYVEIFGVFMVGVGSFLFHMTLLREHQMMDEVAMNFTILMHLYSLLNMEDEIDGEKDANKPRILTLFGLFPSVKAMISGIGFFGTFIVSWAAWNLMEPVIFQSLFGASILTSVIMSAQRAYKKIDVVDSVHLEYMQKARKDKILIFWLVVISSVGGFAVWLLDNFSCPRYEHLKLHSIWHICTGLGCLFYGLFVIHAYNVDLFDRTMAGLNQRTHAIKTSVSWSIFPSITFIEVVEKPKSKIQ